MAQDKEKLFEKIYFMWKGEGEKRNLSIDFYCERYGANVKEFRKWYQGISKAVKEVKVVGVPESPRQDGKAEHLAEEEPRILISTTESGKRSKSEIESVTITCGNVIHLTRKSKSYYISWQDFLSVLETPVIKTLRLRK